MRKIIKSLGVVVPADVFEYWTESDERLAEWDEIMSRAAIEQTAIHRYEDRVGPAVCPPEPSDEESADETGGPRREVLLSRDAKPLSPGAAEFRAAMRRNDLEYLPGTLENRSWMRRKEPRSCTVCDFVLCNKNDRRQLDMYALFVKNGVRKSCKWAVCDECAQRLAEAYDEA